MKKSNEIPKSRWKNDKNRQNLYYFQKDSGMELGFLIRYKGECVPVEVKAHKKASACGIMAAMALLSYFLFIPKDSVAKIIVPIAGIAGILTVIFAVPNAKEED